MHFTLSQYISVTHNEYLQCDFFDQCYATFDCCSMEKQKRRVSGFIKQLALKDSVHKQIQIMTDDDRRQMAFAFLRVRADQATVSVMAQTFI